LKKILKPRADFLGIRADFLGIRADFLGKIEIVFRLKLLFLTTIILKNINSHNLDFFQKNSQESILRLTIYIINMASYFKRQRFFFRHTFFF
jgi:hypothetical protein